MPDALTTFTNFINSPPGQFVAGGALAGIVWKFFDKVEEKLNDDTKLEIAVWLLGVKPLGPKMEPWPETFAKVFDRIFGKKHLSWKCFLRSALASCAVCSIAWLLIGPKEFFHLKRWQTVLLPTLSIVVGNILPDYISLLESRLSLMAMKRLSSWPLYVLLLVVDFWFTAQLALVGTFLGIDTWGDIFVPTSYWMEGHGRFPLAILLQQYAFTFQQLPKLLVPRLLLAAKDFVESNRLPFVLYVLPAFFTSIWLWLYAGSGFLLKFAHQFDKYFGWFNRLFDIEKKPLSSIGLVAGCIVALVYWAVAFGAHLVHH